MFNIFLLTIFGPVNYAPPPVIGVPICSRGNPCRSLIAPPSPIPTSPSFNPLLVGSFQPVRSFIRVFLCFCVFHVFVFFTLLERFFFCRSSPKTAATLGTTTRLRILAVTTALRRGGFRRRYQALTRAISGWGGWEAWGESTRPRPTGWRLLG